MNTYECNFQTLVVVGAGLVIGMLLRLTMAILFNI